jgi:hypothetical protein
MTLAWHAWSVMAGVLRALGVKGSQVQILSSRPAFTQVGGRFRRKAEAAFLLSISCVVALWSRSFDLVAVGMGKSERAGHA